MIVIGIDTGLDIGVGILRRDETPAGFYLNVSTNKKSVVDLIYEYEPDIVVFEEIVNYGLGMDRALTRAIADIGYFTRVCDEVSSEVHFFTRQAWAGLLFPAVKSKSGRMVRKRKHTLPQMKSRVRELFGLEKKRGLTDHEVTAGALINAYLEYNNLWS